MTPAPAPAAFPGWARLRPTVASRSVAAGVWLVMLPAVFSGVIWVLTPLRLDELGASGLAVGAVFLISALVEGAASPAFGRLSDRRGRLWPIRIGLVAAALMSLVLPLPEVVVLLGLAIVLAELALGFCWTPAMALLSDTVERAGVQQWLAFALVNLAVVRRPGAGRLRWAAGSPTPPPTRSPTGWSPRSWPSARPRSRRGFASEPSRPGPCQSDADGRTGHRRRSRTGRGRDAGAPRRAGGTPLGRDRRRRRPQRADRGRVPRQGRPVGAGP